MKITLKEFFKTIWAAFWEIRWLLLFIGVPCLIIFFFAKPAVSYGESMEESLHDGDIMLGERVTYKFKDPERFDIVMFESGDEEEPLYVKRIIGLPGEKVRIDDDGNIYINGEILKENYGKTPIDDPGIAEGEITLADDEVFCLGDNREVSEDSRYIGPVKIKDIKLHLYFRVWPISDFGKI